MLAQAHALSQHPNIPRPSTTPATSRSSTTATASPPFTSYEEIDDDHRQYFAEIELAANPIQRAIRRDCEIAFLRLHTEIVRSARLART